MEMDGIRHQSVCAIRDFFRQPAAVSQSRTLQRASRNDRHPGQSDRARLFCLVLHPAHGPVRRRLEADQHVRHHDLFHVLTPGALPLAGEGAESGEGFGAFGAVRQGEARRYRLGAGVHGEEVALGVMNLAKTGDGGIGAQGIKRGAGKDFHLRRQALAAEEHGGELFDFARQGLDIFPTLRGRGDALVALAGLGVVKPTVSVPGDSVRAVNYCRPGGGEELFAGGEVAPAAPALEILHDRPACLDGAVTVLAHVGVITLYVHDRLCHAVGVGFVAGLAANRINFRHENIGVSHVGGVAGNGEVGGNGVGLAGKAPGRVRRLHQTVVIGEFLRLDVLGGVIAQVPGENRGMMAADFQEPFVGNARVHPKEKTVFPRRRQKFRVVTVAVGVGEVEAGGFQVGKGAVETVGVELTLANGINADGKELLPVDDGHAVVAQFCLDRRLGRWRVKHLSQMVAALPLGVKLGFRRRRQTRQTEVAEFRRFAGAEVGRVKARLHGDMGGVFGHFDPFANFLAGIAGTGDGMAHQLGGEKLAVGVVPMNAITPRLGVVAGVRNELVGLHLERQPQIFIRAGGQGGFARTGVPGGVAGVGGAQNRELADFRQTVGGKAETRLVALESPRAAHGDGLGESADGGDDDEGNDQGFKAHGVTPVSRMEQGRIKSADFPRNSVGCPAAEFARFHPLARCPGCPAGDRNRRSE